MRSDKNEAFKLRLGGRSYTEIQKILGAPKSTLSGWFSGLVLSDDLREKINRRARKKSLAGLLKRNKNQTQLAIKRAQDIRALARRDVRVLSFRDLFILGVALYWAEGYKRLLVKNGRELTHHVVSLTNSDPYLIKAFLRFLRECCGVEEQKIKAGLRIFPHQNEQELLRYWHRQTGITYDRFGKVYHGISKSSAGKRPFNRLTHGVIQICVADTKLFHKIMGYIEGTTSLV